MKDNKLFPLTIKDVFCSMTITNTQKIFTFLEHSSFIGLTCKWLHIIIHSLSFWFFVFYFDFVWFFVYPDIAFSGDIFSWISFFLKYCHKHIKRSQTNKYTIHSQNISNCFERALETGKQVARLR